MGFTLLDFKLHVKTACIFTFEMVSIAKTYVQAMFCMVTIVFNYDERANIRSNHELT